ncbi:MAG: ABC transporter ATP-binding protein [Promicromonosporaceae bacterium]|nr:ABC transporter ATP-binding protein [Promicromonosporaceae bacterium]
MAFIEFADVTKTYGAGAGEVHALRGATFTIEQGQLVVIVGQSGAGKTTLLNILGGMDTATSGTVTVGGADVTAMNRRQLALYRRHDVGFVFQFYNLIANLTAKENVELAAQLTGSSADPLEALAQVGLEARQRNFPAQLSGGEQQRVSIARALTKRPQLLLCDEPTGALDAETGKSVLRLLLDATRQRKQTVIIITHNSALTALADQVLRLNSGLIVSAEANEHPASIDEIEW